MIPQELITREFSTIGAADIIDLVSNQISSLCRDMNQRIIDDEMTYIIKSITTTLQGKYRNWRVIDFVNCLDNGKIGNYSAGVGTSTRITVAKLSGWMYQHNAKVMSSIINNNIKQQAAMRNSTVNMIGAKAGDEYGDAVAWKLQQRLTITYPKASPHYVRAMSKINALSLDMVVEAMSKNSVNKLITW